MDTQVHKYMASNMYQHKNFVNMSEIKQNQVTIYPFTRIRSRTSTFYQQP